MEPTPERRKMGIITLRRKNENVYMDDEIAYGKMLAFAGIIALVIGLLTVFRLKKNR